MEGALTLMKIWLNRVFLSGDECCEVVEGGGPSGLSVVAASRVRPVAERHPRLDAVVDELYALIVGSASPHVASGPSVGRSAPAQELDDLITDRELGAAIAMNHRELVAPAHAQVDMDPIARRVKVLGAVPRRHLVGVGPCLKYCSRGESKMRVIRTC